MPQFVPQFALEDLAERVARQLVPDFERLGQLEGGAVRTTSAASRSCHTPSDTDSIGPRRATPAASRTPASLTVT
jgi:hypothetical protein